MNELSFAAANIPALFVVTTHVMVVIKNMLLVCVSGDSGFVSSSVAGGSSLDYKLFV